MNQLTVGDLRVGDIFVAEDSVYMVIDPNDSNYTHLNKDAGTYRETSSVVCLSNRSGRAMYGELRIRHPVDKILGRLVLPDWKIREMSLDFCD